MRSLIHTSQLDAATMTELVEYACGLLSDGYATSLRGHTCAILFFENSTRTKLSFELAAQHMEMNILHFDSASSSLSKGETFEDTLDTLIAMDVEAVILRHAQDGLHERLAEYVGDELAILNAGSGVTDHPTQALLDLLTLYQHADKDMEAVKNMTLGIVGDLRHSRVATAHIAMAKIMGYRLLLVAPDALQTAVDISGYDNIAKRDSLKNSLPEMDVVMALRLQKERLSRDESCEQSQALVESVQLTEALLNVYAKPTCKVMHPGPVNWGVELGHCLEHRDHPRTLINKQVRNGVAMRQACLEWCLDVQEAPEALEVNPAL